MTEQLDLEDQLRENPKTLTEQWKKGELDSGLYYVEATNGDTYVDLFTWTWYSEDGYNGSWEHSDDQEIKNVLTPVPEYEEWQPFTNSYFEGLSTKDIAELAKKSIRLTTQHCKDNEEISILREQLKVEICMVDNLINENQQLKELLKECRDMINNHCSWQVMDRPNHYVKKIENDIYEPLLTKINNAIGEKK